MSHSHGHSHGVGGGSHHCHDEECASSHSVTAAPAGGHSHGTSAKPAPCDYCASIKAHGASQKAAQRRAAARRGEEDEDDASEYETDDDAAAVDAGGDDSDDPDKFVLPGQRVAMPIDRRITMAFTIGCVILAFKVVRSIIIERTS